jgi:carbamoyltransferase
MRVVAFNVTHDSSVCSYVDGKIEFYCKEERISKVKRDKAPYKSLELLYEQNFGPIDHVLFLTPTYDYRLFENYSRYVLKKFDVELENYSSLQHHDCHASISFYNSGFEKSLVFVIDRNGSTFFSPNGNELARESESVYIASYNEGIFPVQKSFWINDENEKVYVKNLIKDYYQKDIDIEVNNPFSIVKVYEAATTLIGQHALENGKTMGLSSYGENLEYPPLFLNGSAIRNYFSSIDVSFSEQNSSCFFGDEDKITDNLAKDNYQFYANKAKHVQLETQKESLRLIKHYVEKTGINKVCIVGGYGLNVVANNYYIKNLPDVEFYFEPLSDDSGITLGACMLKYRQVTGDQKIYKLENNFYHYYKKQEINTNKKQFKTADDIVNILVDQKIVAVFQGAPEAGPRALGHRSLLFDPRNSNGKNLVNILKRREWYRPFAGIILEEHFSNYFETLGLKKSEYMVINFDAKPDVRDYVPSIVHVDNTCRVQTVSKKDGFIFELLTSFYERTGCPMLLNTSFNLAGKPLIQTEDDALEFIDAVKDLEIFSGVYFVDEKIFVPRS